MEHPLKFVAATALVAAALVLFVKGVEWLMARLPEGWIFAILFLVVLLASLTNQRLLVGLPGIGGYWAWRRLYGRR